jgi:hypothetical protein
MFAGLKRVGRDTFDRQLLNPCTLGLKFRTVYTAEILFFIRLFYLGEYLSQSSAQCQLNLLQ